MDLNTKMIMDITNKDPDICLYANNYSSDDENKTITYSGKEKCDKEQLKLNEFFTFINYFNNQYACSSSQPDFANIYINSEELIITSNPSISEFIGMAHARNGANQFWGDKILVYFN